MKLNRNIFFFSVISSFVFFILSILFYAFNLIFLYNLFNNLLAGTIVLIGTSLYSYFNDKHRLIIKLQNSVIEMNSLFNKVKYFNNYVLSYEDWCKDLKKNSHDSLAQKEYDRYILSQEEKILAYIEPYIKICDYNFNDFWSIYDDLFFIFKNKKIRRNIYEMYFKYIYYDIVHNLRAHVFVLKKSKSNAIYYGAAINEIKIMQDYIFEVTENDDDFEKKILDSKIEIVSVIRNFITNKEIVIGNKVTTKLNREVFEFIKNM